MLRSAQAASVGIVSPISGRTRTLVVYEDFFLLSVMFLLCFIMDFALFLGEI